MTARSPRAWISARLRRHARRRPGIFAGAGLLASLLLGAGCAALDSNESTTEQDIAQLRQDVNALRASAQRGRAEADAIAQIDRRNREQSAETSRQLTALSARLETMSGELTRLSARVDEIARRQDTGARRTPSSPGGSTTSSAPPAASIPPASSSTSPSASSSNATPSAPARPAAGSAIASPSGGATAEEAYQAAYLDFSRGRYPLAITGFRDFLRRYPDAPQAESAQYGIGESYYSLASTASAEGQSDKATRALEQAVQEFRKVTTLYPRGAKVPTALYKEALALAELKQTTLAQSRLQYLLDHFPQSEEAPLAKERLATLRR